MSPKANVSRVSLRTTYTIVPRRNNRMRTIQVLPFLATVRASSGKTRGDSTRRFPNAVNGVPKRFTARINHGGASGRWSMDESDRASAASKSGNCRSAIVRGSVPSSGADLCDAHAAKRINHSFAHNIFPRPFRPRLRLRFLAPKGIGARGGHTRIPLNRG